MHRNLNKRRSALLVSALSFFILGSVCHAQSGGNDTAYREVADRIIDAALEDGHAYSMLAELTGDIGARLSGSPAAAAAVEWSRQKMQEYGLDSVYLQEIDVPHWVRGEIETGKIVYSRRLGAQDLTITALGGSVATPPLGITAPVVEVRTMEELRALGDRARGKIIFFNRPMDRKQRRTFSAYGGAVGQRSNGAVEAARAGGVAALVRSMTTALDDVPHTGALRYAEGVTQIPAAAVSTLDAELISDLLASGDSVVVNLQLDCRTLPDAKSANVIGELRGKDLPDEVIVVGGHLDSWDVGEGAHDDGAGCVQAIEAVRLLKVLGLRPRRTLRAVMFMNEENGLRGGRAYAARAAEEKVTHIAAIESDRGGFAPRGFSVNARGAKLESVSKWGYLLRGIGADRIVRGGGGADIGPLERLGTVTIGLVPESARYFDYHHSPADTFDKVNERELTLGAAAMAVLLYVLGEEGV